MPKVSVPANEPATAAPPCLTEALRLTEAGLWVVPQTGKRALALGWDRWRIGAEELPRYFAADPGLNIAIVLSAGPCLDVECDTREAEAELQKLLTKEELHTPTWTAKRGKHRLYLRPQGLPDAAKVEVRGIEVRIGNRPALSTVPPSKALDGTLYRWLPGLSIWEVEPLPMPQALVELVCEVKRPKRPEPAGKGDDAVFLEGHRNTELNSLGCRMVCQGANRQTVKNLLTGCNKNQCQPPLPDSEIASICKSVEGFRAKRAELEKQEGGGELLPLPCEDWRELTQAWRQALRWIPGLDRALSVMLASVVSTEAVGDQLWVKCVGPPSSGKSVLCEALSVAKKYVYPKSTVRGLFSGYQSDAEGTEDHGLIGKIKNKTLVTKDGDTLLQMPDLPRILAEFRDAYDRTTRTHYRNKMSRDYEGFGFTFILCGTEALRALDSSELGERLVDVVICHQLPSDLEAEIALRKVRQAARDAACMADGQPESKEPPELVRARQLTGGYVCWLRENAGDLLKAVALPDARAEKKLVDWGLFVAFMRSRPSKRQDEVSQRELSFRLCAQLTRLGRNLAVVLNRKSFDAEVMARVKGCALDTARGRVLEYVKKIRTDGGARGLSVGTLALAFGDSEEKVQILVRHLGRIGALAKFRDPTNKARRLWRLTPTLERLCREVLDGGNDDAES